LLQIIELEIEMSGFPPRIWMLSTSYEIT